MRGWKWLLLAPFLINTGYAEEKIICSAIKAPAAVSVVNSQLKLDKAKHCAVSCILSLDCPVGEVYIFGLMKEFADLLGAGKPELDDIKANRIGISFFTTGRATNQQECLTACIDYDWRQI